METNLDRISAEIGFKLVNSFTRKEDFEKLETLVTKAIGVLIEDGLLAYVVWLRSLSDKEKKYTRKIEEGSINLLKNIINTNKDNLITISLKIAEDIQKTLLARQLLERMLVYARYRAKAMQKGD